MFLEKTNRIKKSTNSSRNEKGTQLQILYLEGIIQRELINVFIPVHKYR